MELNALVSFRSNTYHLRAINDYNLNDGTCKVQLLGPILEDALDTIPLPSRPGTIDPVPEPPSEL
jgi:hypothetical protein